MNFHIDYETFSEADLPEVGAYRYAEDVSTEILMLAIASETEGPFLWVAPRWRSALASDPQADRLILDLCEEEEALVWAHSVQFEWAVTRYCAGPLTFLRGRPKQMRCTAALARKACIPASLEKAGEFLRISQAKFAEGKSLVRRFCCPLSAGKRKGQRMLPTEDPEGFAKLGGYCLQDVRAETEIHADLKPFTLRDASLDAFLLDMHLNDRGIAVNVPALRNAKVMVDELTSGAHAQFKRMTGLLPTQKQAVKDWLHTNGLPIPNMQGVTIKEALLVSGQGVWREALTLYAELNYAATKKIDTMLECANADGRLRGQFIYHGAHTGRWASVGVQVQNFKKPTMKQTNLIYQMVRDGRSLDDIDFLFGNPLEALASSIRHFIDAGRPIFDADYAGIEARVVCWLAGQEDALKRFREGVDSYKQLASVVYNRPVSQIDNPSPERDLGKEGVLGGGFGLGPGKFLVRCHVKGLTFVTQELAERTIAGFRAMHPKIVAFWYKVDEAVRQAITKPGHVFRAGPLSFVVREIAGIPFLLHTLPSGRTLSYPHPKLEIVPVEDRRPNRKWDDEPQITFYGQLEGKSIWGRVKTYGASIVQDATQATAADVMSLGACNAVAAGYDVFALIHDQALAVAQTGQTVEGYVAELTRLPPWADGLPIKAEGKITPYYKK